MYDWANSAFATVILAAVLPVYFVSLVPTGGVTLPVIGGPLTATALWSYAVAGSMTLVALIAPGLGAQADRSRCRRRWLVILSIGGAFATCSLALAGPGRYLLAAALFMIANVCFAAANIFYNAFLPALAQGPEIDRLSARGFALGYIGGGPDAAAGLSAYPASCLDRPVHPFPGYAIRVFSDRSVVAGIFHADLLLFARGHDPPNRHKTGSRFPHAGLMASLEGPAQLP